MTKNVCSAPSSSSFARRTSTRPRLEIALAALVGACTADVAPEPKPSAPAAEVPAEAQPAETVEATSPPVAAEPAPAAPVVPVPGAPASFADLVERVRPGVVNIFTAHVTQAPRYRHPYIPYGRSPAPARVERSLGSGFLVDHDGHILTNAHVIEGATSIRVVFADDSEHDATIVGVDPATDVAVIRIEPFEGMMPLELGDSDVVRVGDWTLAVGNPFGLSSTVTAGILSARSRRDVPLGGRVRYVDFLQTDASINPGNSGGPLLDMNGRVIGINTAINREGQGIGFAIPSNMVRELYPQLVDVGRVRRGWLGVFIEEVTQEVAAAMQIGATDGALVTRTVPGGPAELAGVQPGDVIVQFDGESVAGAEELKWMASAAPVGEPVNVLVRRGPNTEALAVVMGELPE